MEYEIYFVLFCFVVFFLSFNVNAESWVSLQLDGKALDDSLPGPYLTLGSNQVNDSFACSTGGREYYCAWLAIYNKASSFKIIYDPIMGAGTMVSLGWSINNVPGNPNPAMGTNQINGTPNDTRQGWLSSITPILASTCTVETDGCTMSVSFINPIYILVTSGPAGKYIINGNYYEAVAAESTIYARWTMNSAGGYVYQGSASQNTASLVIPPIDEPTLYCDFSIDNNTIDLGVVDQSTALGTKSHVNINALCNEDVSVELKVNNLISSDMGGLGINIFFDNDNTTGVKSNWEVLRKQVGVTPLNAEINKVGSLIPGEYHYSSVVNIEYN